MAKVLVVDDDPHIREVVQLFLKKEGFEVHEAADGVEALASMEALKADLVVLDVMMPNMDGWELCRRLREAGDCPILMITAKRETSDKLMGFKLGTDDYLVKPFDPMELVARVKALLKRYRVSVATTLQVGTLSMDRASHEAGLGGRALNLPPKEFELLFDLACHPGKTRLRDQLIEDIWGYDFEGNERTLDVHINRLRERFPEKESGFRIQTIRGLGYRLEIPS
jgi:DNA-binding response OmpR family regulator